MKSKFTIFCFSFLFFLHQPIQAQGPCDSPLYISDFNIQNGMLQALNVDVNGTPISAGFSVRSDFGLDLFNFREDTGPLNPAINVFDLVTDTLELGCINAGAIRYFGRFGFSGGEDPAPLFVFEDAGVVTDPSETGVWNAQWGPSCNNLTDSDDMILNKDHSAQIGPFDGTWNMNQGALTVNLFGGSDFNGKIDPEGVHGVFNHFGEDNCFTATPKNSTTLALNDDRFKVEIDWRDFLDSSGQATHTKLTGESGVSFIGDSDARIYTRILDNCSMTNNFWVFAAATTNVEYTLTVTDTQAGVTKEYFNPLGTAAPAIIDTSAFATCP